MAIKKSDLYSSLWASCDQLRGGMDASQYKDYVLFMLFIKYISDKYADAFAPPVTIPPGASFKAMIELKGKSDIGDKINTQIIQPLIDANSRLARSDFPDFNDPNKLGEGQAMVDRLTNLVAIFQRPELDFSKNRADNDDILGDAYEYLMRNFAIESGKSKGQFLTPSEVSSVIAQIVGISPDNARASTTASDPTCGSASLLLKVAAQAGTHITLEGQEKDVTTAGLARMNMILHDFPTANILAGNTLANPKFKQGDQLRTYDYVVANPPFSDKGWRTGLTPDSDPYQRFQWGVPPTKQGDYAYLLHIIRTMNRTGKGACILPHGVLFRGHAEAEIRQQLVRSGILKGIIGLPPNLFYGTGIPACILVLDKENAQARTGIFMIDASRGFKKDGNKNRLRAQDIHRIVDTFRKQTEVPRYARMVPFDEIADAKNDYNLNLPRYIDSTEPEDQQDIDGHLRGGIPESDIDALGHFWRVLPDVRAALFQSAGRDGYSTPKLPSTAIKAEILGHPDFTRFTTTITKLFERWRTDNTERLRAFDRDAKPKALITAIAEDLLATFHDAPLLDGYDIYQHLMDYWDETMQDDCYLIAAEGWVAKTYRLVEEVKNGKKKGSTKDKGWTCDLVPKALVIARFFAEKQSVIDTKQVKLADLEATLTEHKEEHGSEDGPLYEVSTKSDALEAYAQALVDLWGEQDKSAFDAYTALTEKAQELADHLLELANHHHLIALKNGKGRLTAKAVKDRLGSIMPGEERTLLKDYIETQARYKATTKQAEARMEAAEKELLTQLGQEPLPEECKDLHVAMRYLQLLDEQTKVKSEIKEAESELDTLAYEKYPELTEDEVKTLVIEDKWMTRIAADVKNEVERVSQRLTGRVQELAERYATPLPALVDEVETLSARVDGHLERMGAVWK
ncbi:type I restriction endonuclease subunit M [Lamprobacter modestohalophilus]|uniref:site-specific DNA-methyltransferase (adenine-specific) n=1 Tax=Lamprobacter modestohalophilus TaxID=1064514 RepID=A0A9X0WB43_9GAMM|nr:class I SAM-dependent DNA methyltransferase [Lamprobacter modestohalophilus]MBK1620335.1 type I restriction endonuclease subunit M [Lamprobacter modestohalophilus]